MMHAVVRSAVLVLAALGGPARGDFLPEIAEEELGEELSEEELQQQQHMQQQDEMNSQNPYGPGGSLDGLDQQLPVDFYETPEQTAARLAGQAFELRTSAYRSYSTSLLHSSPQPVFSMDTAEGVNGFHRRQIDVAVHDEAMQNGWASGRGTCTEAQFGKVYEDATGQPSGSTEARDAWDEVCVHSRCADQPWVDTYDPPLDLNDAGPTPEATEERISEWFADKSSADQPGPAVAVRAEAVADVSVESLGGELERSAFADEFRSTLADLLDVSEGRIEIDAITPGSAVVRFTIHPEGFPADQQNNHSVILRRALAISPARAAALALDRGLASTMGAGGVASGSIKQFTPMQLSCSHLNATSWPGGIGVDLSGSWSDAFMCPSAWHLQLDANCTPPCDKEVCCMCDAGTAGTNCQYSRGVTCNGHGEPTATGSCTCDDWYQDQIYQDEYDDLGVSLCATQMSREDTCNGCGDPTGASIIAGGGSYIVSPDDPGSGGRTWRLVAGHTGIISSGTNWGECDCDFIIPGVPWLDNITVNQFSSLNCKITSDNDDFYGYLNTSWWMIQLPVAIFLGIAITGRTVTGRTAAGGVLLDDDAFPLNVFSTCCATCKDDDKLCGVCLCSTLIFFFVWPPALAAAVLVGLLYCMYRCCEAAHRRRATSRPKASGFTDELNIPMQPITSRKPDGLNQDLLGGGGSGGSDAATR